MVKLPWARPAAPAPEPDEQVFRTVCRPNCFGLCGHEVTVRDGRIVKSVNAQLPDPAYNRICLRGLVNLERVHDDQRITQPLRRVGPRGAGQWRPISWDEAITELADNWRAVQAEYGPQAVVFMGGSGNPGLLHGSQPGLVSRLRNVLGATQIDASVDVGITAGVQSVVGDVGRWPGNGPEQMVHARTIMICGHNVTEATIHTWHFVLDAKQAGAQVIVIDPIFTHAAAQAHRYIPCRPGSDPVLILAMMHCIIRDGRHNIDFLQRKTVAPYLVRADGGRYLRMRDIGHTDDDRVVVADADGELVPAEQATDPAITGRREVAGVQVATAFELLVERLADYPPEVAAELTEIPATTIEELAAEFTAGPTTLLAGFGAQAFNNGSMLGRCYMTLAAITGNIGLPGADIGAHWEPYPGVNKAFATPTGQASPVIPLVALPQVLKSGKLRGEPWPIRSLFTYMGNILGNGSEQNRLRRDVWERFDFICSVDLVFNDTTNNADLVLPAVHWHEVADVPGALGQHPYLQYSEKVLDPPGQAKPDGEIARLIASAMGVGQYFDRSDDEYLAEILDSDYSRRFGITLDALKAAKAMRAMPDPWLGFGGDQSFATPDGRMHFYNESPRPRLDYGQELPAERERLPVFYPPTEAWPDHELAERYPLVLLSERSRFRVHTMWFGTPTLRELDPEPIVRINPVDAAPRGIAEGDLVEVYNDRGHAVARAVLTEAIKPGLLSYPKGWQRHQHVAGSFSELNSLVSDPIGVNQSFFDARAEVRRWEGE